MQDNEAQTFLAFALQNPLLAEVLRRVPALELEDYWIASGCLVQSVWNSRFGHPAGYGIVDYDLLYCDADTSWHSEDRIIKAGLALFGELGVDVQIRNQARVPIWYKDKFGMAYPPVAQASDTIGRFPCATMAVGVRPADGGFRIFAPFGVSLALAGHLRPNQTLPLKDVYDRKCARWRATWPQLTHSPWDGA